MSLKDFDIFMKNNDLYYIENNNIINVYSELQSDNYVRFTMKNEDNNTFTLYYRNRIIKDISNDNQLFNALQNCDKSSNILFEIYIFFVRYGSRA